MALLTKCILAEKEPKDGFRVSVMSRHTCNDGITKRSELDKMCDSHYFILGPSSRLIGSWLRGELFWEEFEEKFVAEIKASITALALLETIVEMALIGNVTFLCIEEEYNKCHRSLLAKICQDINPDLRIVLN